MTEGRILGDEFCTKRWVAVMNSTDHKGNEQHRARQQLEHRASWAVGKDEKSSAPVKNIGNKLKTLTSL